MKKINILFHSPYPHAKMGGQISLMRLIENLDRSRFTPFIIVASKGGLTDLAESMGIRTFIFGIPGFKLKNYFKLKQKKQEFIDIIEANDIDIIHSDHDKFTFFVSQWTKGLRVKTIFHSRVTSNRPYDKFLQKRVDIIVGIANAVLERFDKSKYGKKFRLIYNGVDCNVFYPVEDKSEMKLQLGLNTEQKLVVYVGRIERKKGIYDLLNSIKIMKDNGRGDFNVLLIGEEPPENALDEISGAIVELGLSNVVKKIGQKSDIANWIQASDVLILPSHEEGMGRVVLEAMACGTPVIGGNVGGIKEAITEEVGLLITPESPEELSLAIGKLLDNKPLRDRMGIAGRKRALEYFDITVHAVNMMNLFQEMVMQNEN